MCSENNGTAVFYVCSVSLNWLWSLLQVGFLQSCLCTFWSWFLCQSWWWHIFKARYQIFQGLNWLHDMCLIVYEINDYPLIKIYAIIYMLLSDRLSLLLAKERSHPQTYIGCMKKGPVFTDPKLKWFVQFRLSIFYLKMFWFYPAVKYMPLRNSSKLPSAVIHHPP